MSREFEVIGSTAKVTGEAMLPEGTELEHGDELYVVCRVTVKEVSFPETKDGAIVRVHKAKADDAYVVGAEDAERVIAAERERVSGQGNILAELQRVEGNGARSDNGGFVVNAEPVASMHNDELITVPGDPDDDF